MNLYHHPYGRGFHRRYRSVSYTHLDVYKRQVFETMKEQGDSQYNNERRQNCSQCCDNTCLLYTSLYNTETQQVTHIKNDISEEITDIEQIDESHFFIGTEMGIPVSYTHLT